MDATNPSAVPTFASRTPLHIGAVGLTVRDLDGVAAFYRDVLGLTMIERAGGVARLGAGGSPFWNSRKGATRGRTTPAPRGSITPPS